MEQFRSIIESFGITDEVQIEKVMNYINNYIRMQTERNIAISSIGKPDLDLALLPLSLKLMKELDGKYEITDNPMEVQDYEISFKVKKEDVFMLGFDEIIKNIGDIIIKEIKDLIGDHNIIIYTLINSISVISEATFEPRVLVRTRIKLQ